MDRRYLTGKWYLDKRRWGGYNVMVQVEIERWDDPTYGNGGGDYAPKRTEYQKATKSDLLDLGLNYA
jgi:hypothetical protein